MTMVPAGSTIPAIHAALVLERCMQADAAWLLAPGTQARTRVGIAARPLTRTTLVDAWSSSVPGAVVSS